MKNKLLLLAAVLLTTLSTRAVTAIEEGVDYYILNVETSQFLGGQNYWGTQGAISEDAGVFQFVTGELNGGAGGYNIVNTLVSVSNKNLGTNLYTDNNGQITVKDDEEAFTTKSVDGIWAIEDLGGGVFAFRCVSGWKVNTDDEGVQSWEEVPYGYMTRSETAGYRKGYELEFKTELTDAAKFYIMTYDEAAAYIANIAASNNVSYNFLIKNPDFCRYQSTAAWNVSTNCTNKNLAGGDNNNMCAESYRSPFAIYQNVKDVPAGRYQLSCQGFYRHDLNTDENRPFVYVGSTTGNASDNADTYEILAKSELPLRTGTENSMAAASTSFQQGNYYAEKVRFNLTEMTDLQIGFACTNGNYWAIFDNVQLMSYSNVAQYAQEILEDITYPVEGVGSASVKSAYESAYNSFKAFAEGITQGDGTTFDDVDEKYDEFTAAETAWKNSIAAWSTYTVVADKAKTLYTQITSQEGKYISSPSLGALNTYTLGSATAYGPGSSDGGYTFVNGCYNYIMNTMDMDDDAIAAEVEFLNGLMSDVKKTVTQPGMDVTFLLTNADFTDPEQGGWSNTHTMSNWTLYGGLSGWPVAEAFANHTSDTFDLYQVVENAPAGLYSISVNAFYRPAGDWDESTPVLVELYMGSVSSKIQSLAADPIENDIEFNGDTDNPSWDQGTIAKSGTNCYYWSGDDVPGITDAMKETWKSNQNEDDEIRLKMQNSTDLTVNGKYGSDATYNENYLIPNSMEGASIAFSAGRYPMTVYGEVSDDNGDGTGTLRIGLRSTTAMAYGAWCLWGGFNLQLLGKNREAMKSQLEQKLAELNESGVLEEGNGVQEVFLDSVVNEISTCEALLASSQSTYDDFKAAYDEVVYYISKWDVYKSTIAKFDATQTELETLISSYTSDDSHKEFASKVYALYNGLRDMGMISLTDEDLEKEKAFDKVLFGVEPEEVTAELINGEEYDEGAIEDGAYASTYDRYYEFYEKIKVELGSIYIEVAGTGTSDDPENVTDQLLNPHFQEDGVQWNGGNNWGSINVSEAGSGEQYENVFNTYQMVHLPKGYYVLAGFSMDRRGSWENILKGDDDYNSKAATYLYVNLGNGTEASDTTSIMTASAKHVASIHDITEGAGSIATTTVGEGDDATTWYTPNTMAQFNSWMAYRESYGYDNLGGVPLEFEVTEDDGVFASIGFYRRQVVDYCWFIVDEIRLYYATDGYPSGEATSVNTLSTTEKYGKEDGKYMENGRIVIYNNGKKFNVAGQAVK